MAKRKRGVSCALAFEQSGTEEIARTMIESRATTLLRLIEQVEVIVFSNYHLKRKNTKTVPPTQYNNLSGVF
jgi:hypothetical protein